MYMYMWIYVYVYMCIYVYIKLIMIMIILMIIIIIYIIIYIYSTAEGPCFPGFPRESTALFNSGTGRFPLRKHVGQHSGRKRVCSMSANGKHYVAGGKGGVSSNTSNMTRGLGVHSAYRHRYA